MPHLLRKPKASHGLVHDISAKDAGWTYVGFQLYHLGKGETVADATGLNEAVLVLVEGRADIIGAGQSWGNLGDRMSVFEKSPPHCLYLPNGSDWQATATKSRTP